MSDRDEVRNEPNTDDHDPDVAPPLVFRTRRDGVRLDRVLADEIACSRRQARALIRSGYVRVNGRLMSRSPALSAGDEVCVASTRTQMTASQTARLAECPYRILWRGAEFWVLDKPAGVHTHAGRSEKSVAAALMSAHPEFRHVGKEVEGGLVHRLDRDTSGILLAATRAASYQGLRAEFAARAVSKQYWAIVAGSVAGTLMIDRPLARRATRVVPARRGERSYPAVSRVTPLETTSEWSLVEVEIHTGVTHQVRAHLAFAGHALVGDAKYGGPASPAGTREGQLLHARSIVLSDGRAFSAAAPEDFVRAFYRLRRQGLGV
jgi:23S rRNA pseudouridine1911/1915/1917 synthase